MTAVSTKHAAAVRTGTSPETKTNPTQNEIRNWTANPKDKYKGRIQKNGMPKILGVRSNLAKR